MIKFARAACLLLLVTTVQACALSRSEITPDPGLMVENPTTGTAVRIDAVSDARRFEAAPSTPDVPSLSGNELQNADIKARAIARKRNSFGAAMGDIVLPEGQTVSRLVAESLTLAFRKAGYRVLTPSEAGYDQAAPVQAKVNEFWAWFNPGFSSITLSNRIDVTVMGSLPAVGGTQNIRNEASKSAMAAFDSNWSEVISKGLEEFTEKLRAALAAKR